ncbi:hypothetical protein O9H85_08220 [Paenibacillus filicis]|uniref:DUF4145 domain-containing protein n=1 Tax=Paenibacillus gyeongsangnamensis TaxID=3388067 RepID=A0ABT4Q6B8_9BACL|nr:hypothetical protein [Paenibacillus filicis]MCZ8512418.1 hypothetical protein [Paenibacillus filicis]
MDDDLVKTIREIQESMLNPTQQVIEYMRESLRNTKEIAEMTRKLRSGIDQAVLKFSESLKLAYKHLKIIENKTEALKLILVDCGYPPSDKFFTFEISEIIDYYDEHGKEKTEQYLHEYLFQRFDQEELNGLLSEWESFELLSKRMLILRQSINAHVNGNYFIAIPPLLAQLEGMVADGFQHIGRMDGYKMKGYLSDLLSEDHIMSFDSVALGFYKTIVLVNFEHGKPLESYLSRNAILHGADTEYGTPVNSLKSILLFDYIQSRIWRQKQ